MKTLLALVALCLASLALVPSAQASSIGPDSTPDVQCMDVYSETELVGGYWLVRRDSCSAEVFWCPEGSSPPGPPCQEGLFTTSAAAAPAVEVPPYYCFPYERRIEAGPITVIQGGCGNDVRLCDDGDGGSSLLAIRDTGDIKALDTDCIDHLVTLQCSDIYARHEVGPVAIVMTSGCSGHVELCDTPVHVKVDLSCIADLDVDTPPVNCLPYSREISIAPGITIVQGGCGSYVVLCGTRVTADPSSIDPSCLLTATMAASAEPNCLAIYRETSVGPLTQVSRSSCDSTWYMCDDDDGAYEASETLQAYVAGQVADPDAQGLAQCTVDSLGLATTSGVDRTCWRQGQGELQTVTCVDPNSTDCTVYRQQITGVGSSWVCYPSGESGSDW